MQRTKVSIMLSMSFS